MEKRLKILVAPLDWGLGHITRCIPIVNELVRCGCAVWVAGNKSGLALMQQEFPDISVLDIEGYNVIYHPSKKRFARKILMQIPKILGRIRWENRWLKRALKEHGFDVVISDNRFGLYNKTVYCIFITHQLHIQSGRGKWIDRIIEKINYRYINRFNECWVPDFEGNHNLSGKLSHGGYIPHNTLYTGPLSRFEKKAVEKKYDLVILLSGPEPGRTNWEKKLLEELGSYEGNACVVRGLPAEAQIICSRNVDIVNHLPSQELNLIIEQSEWVICRSGYTSVMDLVILKHKAIMVPTPGQPEQEYLAAYLHRQKIFYCVPESRFSIQQSLEEAEKITFNFVCNDNGRDHFKKEIQRVVEKLHKG